MVGDRCLKLGSAALHWLHWIIKLSFWKVLVAMDLLIGDKSR